MASRSNTDAPPEPEDPLLRIAELRRQKDREIAVLKIALEESVKLQSHYAELLNTYDGGKRLKFASAEAWLKRLKKMAEPTVCRRR